MTTSHQAVETTRRPRIAARRSFKFSVAALLLLLPMLTAAPASAAPADSPITGSFFVDLDRDGERDGGESLSGEDSLFPPSGISVTAHDALGNEAAGVVTPGTPPTYSIDVTSLVGSSFRVEFGVSDAGFAPTVVGADSASAVQFVRAGSVADFGVVPPSNCRDGDGAIFLTCYTIADLVDTVVTLDYEVDPGAKTANAVADDTGAVWGLAYDEWTDTIWTSATLRRTFGMGPAGLGGLYAQTTPGGAWQAFDLGPDFTGGFDVASANEEQIAANVARVGIGDIDLSPDGRRLFASNLANNSVYVYDVSGGTPVLETSVAIPDPGCAAGDSHQIWALTVTSATTALVGAVCTAEGTQDGANLTASVIQIDTAGSVTNVPGLTTFPLDYERGCSTDTPDCSNVSHPWTDSSAYLWDNHSNPVWGGAWNDVRQPVLTDIEVADGGELVLGFLDRTSFQHTAQTTWDDSSTSDVNEAGLGWLFMGSGGELLHVANTGSEAAPVYVLDPAITVGGGAEHFNDQSLFNAHQEIASGSVWNHPAHNDVVATVMDPVELNSLGLRISDVASGETVSNHELGGGNAQFKAGGLGDVEGCFIPIEIGNRVWLDLDGDGIQGPGETPLAGVTVTVEGPGLPEGGVQVVTDENGTWTIDSTDGLTHNESYTVTVDPSTNTTPLPGQFTNDDLTPTVIETPATSSAGSNLNPDGTFAADTGNPGENDHTFDAGYVLPYDLALEKTLTSFDIETQTAVFAIEVFNQGMQVEDFTVADYLNAPTAGVWADFSSAANPNGVTDALDVDSDGTLDPGTELAYTWDASDLQEPVMSFDGVLPSGQSVTVPVTLTWNTPLAVGGDIDNWAEISSFDSDGDPGTPAPADADSTPDSDQANDNQPEAAGDPTDGETGEDALNDDADEDDHDVAGVSWWDLTLINERSSIQPFVVDYTTDPPQIAFDISVGNQGSEPAADIVVTDYLPEGTVYSATGAPEMPTETDSGAPVTVTDNGDGTYVVSELDVNDSVTFGIVVDVVDTSFGEFVNGAEISSFVDLGGNPQPDIDSTPDTTNDDELSEDPTNADDPRNSHNDLGFDPDGDGNVNEATPGDEDDHDVEVVVAPFDLALRNTVDTSATTFPLAPGDTVTFQLEVFNQGRTVAEFDLTDTIDLSVWEPFEVADNPDGVTGGDQEWPFTWAEDPEAPVVTVVGELAPGESVTVPITLTIPVGYSDAAGPLQNIAEISRFDDDNDPSNDDPIDIDSTPDQDPDDPTTDNEITENPSSGDTSGDGIVDEDDHDIALVSVLDVALRETLASSTVTPVQPGQDVTFDLEIINQGSVDASDIEVSDYVDLEMWLAFDPASNPEGSTTGDAAIPYTWTADGTDGLLVLDGTIAPGESVMVPVTLTIAPDADLTTLANLAEISAVTATVDDDADPSTDPVALLNADGSPVTDIDSTPDSDNDEFVPEDPDGDALIDDEVDNANGDEDDHDIAVVPPSTWSLGNQVWFDANNDGMIDDGELPIADVAVVLYLDDDGDGLPDLDETGAPIVAATTVTDDDGLYLFDDLAPGDYLVGLPEANFAEGGPLASMTPSTPVEADANTDVDNDANGLLDGAGGVISGPVTLGDSEPTTEPGLDNDPDTDDGNENLTVDFGFWMPQPDLALRVILDPAANLPVTPGTPVTFFIDVTNQGNVAASDLTVSNYIDPELWGSLDPELNPEGVTSGDTALRFSVDPAGKTDALFTLNGVLEPGETATLPITLVVAEGAPLDELALLAEISSFTPVIDDDGDSLTPPVPVVMPDGTTAIDVDSTPDAINDDPLVDDVVDNAGGDEDDHDIAAVTPPTYNLGNQVWLDANNDGVLEPGEDPIAGVVMHLFEDADGDGQADDRNGDGVIDESDALATTTTGVDGAYLFEGLPAGDYIVGAAPENFAPGGALAGAVSSDPTSSDPDDDIDDNDDGTSCDCPDGYVFSGSVTLRDSEPVAEAGLDNNNPNHPDVLSNLTVDMGFWVPDFDLSLAVERAAGQPSSVAVGDEVTFEITVTNEGEIMASDIELVAYLSSAVSLADAKWVPVADGSATLSMPGTLEPGSSMPVSLTLKVTAGGVVDVEMDVAGAVAVNSAGSPYLMPDGSPLLDVDGAFNARAGDVSDSAQVTAVPSPLAFTGQNAGLYLRTAALLILVGGSMLLGVRRRTTATAS